MTESKRDETLSFLADGLRGLHMTDARVSFLGEVWTRRAEVSGWLDSVGRGRFVSHALPVFLHGGDPTGRVVVMGINPGWRPGADEVLETYLSRDADRYVSFHEDFYDHFERLESQLGGSHFWNNLRSKLIALRPEAIVSASKWQAYRDHVVVQDLFPFHSHRKLTDVEDVRTGALAELASATLDGLTRSAAAEVWAFSPEAYALVERQSQRRGDLTIEANVPLSGCTTTGVHRFARLLVANLRRVGFPPLRILAVNTTVMTQPWFSFDKVYCQGSDCSPRLSMADQILLATGQRPAGSPAIAAPQRIRRAGATLSVPSTDLRGFVLGLGPDVNELPPRTNGSLVFRRRRNFVTLLRRTKSVKIDVLTASGWEDGVPVDPGIGLDEARRLIRNAYDLAQ